MTGGSADPIASVVPIRERADLIYLLLDGLRRPQPRKSREAILCALAIARDGSLVPLSLRPVARETERAWRTFLRDLRSRGVGRELRLVCCDDHPALLSAVQMIFPDTPLQISVAHRLLTLARKVDAQFRAACLSEARQIFTAPDLDAAVARFREWRARWLKHGHRAVNSLEADLASCLTFYRFPSSLWLKIRTVNAVEREFRQARRDAPPAPADETDQEPAAGATGPLRVGVPVPTGGPAVDYAVDGWEASVGGRPRRHQMLKPWTVTTPMTLDRIFQGDPMTESLLTYQVPADDELPASAGTHAPAEGPAGATAGSPNGHAFEHETSAEHELSTEPEPSTQHERPTSREEVPGLMRGTPEPAEEASELWADGSPSPEGVPVDGDYPFQVSHARDLSQDADFMWWLQQQRQQQVRVLPVRAIVIATVLGGLITGVLLARGL